MPNSVDVAILLFTGPESGSGNPKKLKIRLWIRIQGHNHNTSSANVLE